MEGFNQDLGFASFVTTFSALARGNANLDTLSIGLADPRVPPLPDCIDGPTAGGLGKHGRFEGDVSNSRNDAGLGDQVNFDLQIFDHVSISNFFPPCFSNYTPQFIDTVEKYGGVNAKGERLVNLKVMQEYKYSTYQMFQGEDKELQFHLGRQLAAYNEAALILLTFTNGKTNQLTLSDLKTIFEQQTFPPNFYRRSSPASLLDITSLGMQIRDAHPVLPGANDANGNWVVDQPVFTNLVSLTTNNDVIY